MSLPAIDILLHWPVPNWKDPPTTGNTFYYVTSIFLALATTAVGARMYSRLFIRRFFGWDDALLLAAWTINFANCILLNWAHRALQWDRHSWDTHLETLPTSLKTFFAAKILWQMGSALVRASILIFFYRLLNHVDLQRFRPIIWANAFLVFAIWASYFFTDLFDCVPVQAYWTWNPESKCINAGLANVVLSAFNTFSEFLIALLPVPVVFRVLPMRRKQRWSVISLLSLGFFVTIAGAVRTYYVWKAFYSYDLNWWSSAHWIASEVEIDVALICACAPTLRPFIGRAFTRHKHIKQIPSTPASASRTPSNRSPTPVFFGNLIKKVSSKRSHKQFEKEQLSSQTSSDATFVYKQYDLEGIRNDGYGYTVNITASPTTGKKKLRKRSYLSRALEEKDAMESDWEGGTGLAALKNVFRTEERTSPDLWDRDVKGGSATHKRKISRDEDNTNGRIIVAQRQSLEVRHSLTNADNVNRGFDYRNPFVRPGESDVRRSSEYRTPHLDEWPLDGQEEKRTSWLASPRAPYKSETDIEKEAAVEDFVRHHEESVLFNDPALTNSKTIIQQPFSHNTSAFRDSSSTLDTDLEKTTDASAEIDLYPARRRSHERSHRPSPAVQQPEQTRWPFTSPQATRSNSFQRGRTTPSPVSGTAHRFPSVATSPINSSHQWVFNQGVSADGNAGIPAAVATTPRSRSAAQTPTPARQQEQPQPERPESRAENRPRQEKRDTADLGRAAESAFLRAWNAVGELDGQEHLTESERAAAEAYTREEMRRARRKDGSNGRDYR